MPASLTDRFTRTYNGTRPIVTTVQSSRSALGATLACVLLTGWPTASAVHFQTYKKDGAGKKIAGSAIDWKGIVSGNNVGSLTLMGGTDVGNAIGDYVEMMPTNAYAEDLAEGLELQHNRDGTHGNITAGTGLFTGALSLQGGFNPGGLFDGWVSCQESWSFASSTTVTVPSNATLRYSIGDYVKLTQTATVKYFIVTAVASTTLTLVGLTGATVANSVITLNSYSKTRNPLGATGAGLPYNPYKFYAWRSSAWTVNNGGLGKVNLNSELFDTNNNFDTVTNFRYTVPIAGFYYLTGNAQSTGSGGAAYLSAIYKNGVEILRGTEFVPYQNFDVACPVAGFVQLAAGDFLELYAYGNGNAGGFLTSNLTFLSGFLVSVL